MSFQALLSADAKAAITFEAGVQGPVPTTPTTSCCLL